MGNKLTVEALYGKMTAGGMPEPGETFVALLNRDSRLYTEEFIGVVLRGTGVRINSVNERLLNAESNCEALLVRRSDDSQEVAPSEEDWEAWDRLKETCRVASYIAKDLLLTNGSQAYSFSEDRTLSIK